MNNYYVKSIFKNIFKSILNINILIYYFINIHNFIIYTNMI
jgi:hypothetical protein